MPPVRTLLCVAGLSAGFASLRANAQEPTRIRAGHGQSIVSVRVNPKAISDGAVAGGEFPHPQPRLAGFSPLVAITTSDQRRPAFDKSPWEHTIESTFAGNAIYAFEEAPYIIGYLDSGAVVDLASDFYALVLGLTGEYMTENTIPIQGVGGTIDAPITHPIGFFAAGFSAINEAGDLNFAALKGHSNVSVVVGPDLTCESGEELTAIMGTPMLSFFNSVIRVDTPRRVFYDNRWFLSPDVQILDQEAALPAYAHQMAMELGGLSPVLTASYFPDPEFILDDIPYLPTQLSLSPVSIPTGALFFSDVLLRQGPASLDNLGITASLMVDTGAQASIISPGIASELNLPVEPDFFASVCGIGGSRDDIPGYYVDFVQMNALGGALRFSRAPFIVLDLPSPAGGTMDGILGMNFFWNRNIIFAGPLTSFDPNDPPVIETPILHISAPVPFAAPDFDLDLHVDSPDANILRTCFTGPAPGISPECTHTDLTGDDSVNLRDFAVLQNCFSGSDPANTACGH